MSVLAIERTGYLDAIDHLRSANHDAADDALTLQRTLDGYGGMAGSTSIAHEFARHYDAAAQAALLAHRALARALAELGLTATRSLANHTRAEAASHLTYAFDEGDLQDGPGDWNLAVSAGHPPTSLGANPVTLPSWASDLLSHLTSFAWPDADAARLHAAATTWHTTGERLDPIHRHLQDAAARLALERSPEIPLAQEVLARARAAVIDLVVAHHQVGSLCEEYAAQVERHHTALLDLLATVRDAGLTTLKGALLGPVTLGLSNVAAAQANLERIQGLLPQLLDVLRSLQAVADGLAGDLAGVTDQLHVTADALNRFGGSSQIGETSRPDQPQDPWLAMHEQPPGHTYSRHVARTDEELQKRLRDSPGLRVVSTYPDESTAISVMQSNLLAHDQEIADWLKTEPERSRAFDIDTTSPIGKLLFRDGRTAESTAARVVLIPEPSFPHGYQILTSYPIAS